MNDMRLGNILLELMIHQGWKSGQSLQSSRIGISTGCHRTMQVASSKYLRLKEREERLGQIFLRK